MYRYSVSNLVITKSLSVITISFLIIKTNISLSYLRYYKYLNIDIFNFQKLCFYFFYWALPQRGEKKQPEPKPEERSYEDANDLDFELEPLSVRLPIDSYRS